MAGLDDLKCLFQPKGFYDAVILFYDGIIDGRGFEQPGMLEGVPAQAKGVGT